MAETVKRAKAKGRKIGNQKEKCKKYRETGRREKNKARRAAKLQKSLAKCKAKKYGWMQA